MIEFRSVRLVEVEPDLWTVQIMVRDFEQPVFYSTPKLPFPVADELAGSTAVLMNLRKELVRRG